MHSLTFMNYYRSYTTFSKTSTGTALPVLGMISWQIPSRLTIFRWLWIGGGLKISTSDISDRKSLSESPRLWNRLNTRGSLVLKVDWLIVPRATLAEFTTSTLLCNGEVVDIAFLDNWKKFNQVALDYLVAVGANRGGGVAGKHSIRVWHKCRVARWKHGVCICGRAVKLWQIGCI